MSRSSGNGKKHVGPHRNFTDGLTLLEIFAVILLVTASIVNLSRV